MDKNKEKLQVPEMKVGMIVCSNVDRYVIEQRLGNGAFGSVYRVRSSNTNNIYAMKTELSTVPIEAQKLKIESEVLKACTLRPAKHFVMLVDKGNTCNVKYLVMPLIGPSLCELFKLIDMPRYSNSTAINLMIQTLEAIRDLHSIGFLHRDIKPANYAIGLNEKETVFILDFGISRFFRQSNGSLNPPRNNVPLVGTLAFTSRNTYVGKDQSRRDDVESWFYMGFVLFLGEVPFRTVFNDRYRTDKEALMNGNHEAWKKVPYPFQSIRRLINRLEYVDQPDYNQIFKKLRLCQTDTRFNVNLSEPLDWVGKDLDAIMSEKRRKAAEENKMTTEKMKAATAAVWCGNTKKAVDDLGRKLEKSEYQDQD